MHSPHLVRFVIIRPVPSAVNAVGFVSESNTKNEGNIDLENRAESISHVLTKKRAINELVFQPSYL